MVTPHRWDIRRGLHLRDIIRDVLRYPEMDAIPKPHLPMAVTTSKCTVLIDNVRLVGDDINSLDAHQRKRTPLFAVHVSDWNLRKVFSHAPALTPFDSSAIKARSASETEMPSAAAISVTVTDVRPSVRIARMWL